MIPIRDHNPSHSFPFVSKVLLGVNVLVFLFMLSLSQQGLESFIYSYALIPDQIVAGNNVLTLLSSMFLHGGFGHIFGNMMFLNIFGDNLEDTLGHLKFLIFYVVCGVAASLLQIFVEPSSTIPNLGASGAIAGLMGGYLVLFPNHKIDILVPLGLSYQTATVPAFTMLGYWILAQFLQGFGSLGVTGGGVAYFAHIGGFIAGVVLVSVSRPFFDSAYSK